MKTIRMKAVRCPSELKLAGMEIKVAMVDGSIRSLSIVDVNGDMVCVSGAYGIEVTVPAPPAMKKVWRLSGALLGIPIQEDFEHEYEAQARQREIEDGSLGVSADRKTLKIEEIEVPVPDED